MEKKDKLYIIIGLFLVFFALTYLFLFLGAKTSCSGELIKYKGLWVCVNLYEVPDCVNAPEGFDLSIDDVNFSVIK